MNLHEALTQTAAYLGLDADELVHFAAETPEWDDMPYGGMSIDREEGQFLYAIVRALKPETVLEIGAYQGVSSQHLYAAMPSDAEMHSMDIADSRVRGVSGDVSWNVHIEDAITADLPPADFVFEDSDHQLGGATAILAKAKALRPRVVISHDYYSHEVYADDVGFQVKAAFDSVFGADTVLGVRWDNAPRGFGLWLNPDWQAPKSVEDAIATRDKEAYVEAKHAAAQKTAPRKRTPAKKAVKR